MPRNAHNLISVVHIRYGPILKAYEPCCKPLSSLQNPHLFYVIVTPYLWGNALAQLLIYVTTFIQLLNLLLQFFGGCVL